MYRKPFSGQDEQIGNKEKQNLNQRLVVSGIDGNLNIVQHKNNQI